MWNPNYYQTHVMKQYQLELTQVATYNLKILFAMNHQMRAAHR